LPGTCIVGFQAADSVWKEDRLRQGLLRAGGVFAAIALATAFLVSFATTRAMRRLRDRMKTLKEGGELESAKNYSGPAEVRELSITFDRMAASLRRSQNALQASERRLSMAYQAARMIVWEHRVDEGVIFLQDPASPSDRMRISLREYLREVHPDDRRQAVTAIRLAMKTGSYNAEFRMRRNGTYVWYSSWGQAVEEEKGLVLIGVSADVTAGRESERYRAERERLLATAEMSGSLAHEINNPLAAVTGALYMAENCAPGDPELSSYLQIASLEARRTAEIVRRLLQLHSSVVAPATFDVVKLWEELIESSQKAIRRNGLRVELHAQDSLPVVGYQQELQHGFKNLLTNAVESSRSGGEIKVKVRPAYCLRSGERGVSVLLCDNGMGIDAEKIEDVFKPFSTTKTEKGSGLGLWVTRAAVLKQGGSIRMRSMQGRYSGTCVRIFLPNRPAA
jgi:signal transduction histidine kinase